MLIKDLGLRVADWPRTSGSRLCAGVVDRDDDGLVRRYRATGVVALGRSTTSEFGIVGNVETAAYGATRNPWNLGHIAGGSSGGSAAAVAAGIVPIAHASDGLGSIRIPAACCGLVGLKPTRDRVPNLPDDVDYALGFVCDHVVTRTVRDSAVMLDLTDYPEPGSPYAIPAKSGPYADEVERNPGRLRVRWSSEAPNGAPVDPEVAAAVERTAAILSGLGHHLDASGLGRAAGHYPQGAAGGLCRQLRRGHGAGDKGGRPRADACRCRAADVGGADAVAPGRRHRGVSAGCRDLRRLSRLILTEFEAFDVFMSPVMTAPPPPIGTLSPAIMDPAEVDRLQTLLYPYTPVFNVTGQPSISLPLAMSSSGLPIGVMFTARYGDEATLFRLAGQLEKEIPWAARRPSQFG